MLNDPAYGTERSYNGLRLGHSLAKRDSEDVRIFVFADAVSCALAGQQTPDGYYNPERMLAAAIRLGAAVGACGSCMAAAGPVDAPERGVYTCSTGEIEVAIEQATAAAGGKDAAAHLHLCVKR